MMYCARLVVAIFSLGVFGQGWAQSVTTTSEDGYQVHHVHSDFQAGRTSIRVLLPDQFNAQRQYRTLFILPVVANADRRFGDGLAQVRQHGFHNRFDLICVAPEFSSPTWLADHDQDPARRDESHFLSVVLPLIEARYPVSRECEGRLLLGFSKSGWGAFSLLLRHPNHFYRAAGWDTGIRMDMGPLTEQELSERLKNIFGSRRNFAAYRISRLIRTRGKQLGPSPRLFYYNTGGKRAHGGAELHRLMLDLEFPHRYLFEEKRAHRWDSGWLPTAVRFLVESPTDSQRNHE